jgi:hypothetical protein
MKCDKAVMMSTTQPKDWFALFKETALEDGKPLSEWVGEALLEKAAKSKGVSVKELRRTLSPRIRRGERG